ncbi:hypothetical protein HII31_03586 [Pseudocercospora fuligena]|uniref:YjgF-like protein n=1 Tax=Pseudocercospora fuligena TaxID=685502 RepID=A0A8H6VJV0_9PEZI|nr:hypothetical protein HII31_03586 [Pseudocercospora fuligena]
MSTSSEVQIFNPPNLPSLAPTYSHISIVPISETKRLVSFAGQTGTGPNQEENKILSFAEQNRRALARVDLVLAAAKCTKKDIVMIRPYVVKLTSLSAEDTQARNEIFLNWWRSTEGKDALTPPDTLIGVDSLWSKETLIEYEVQCISDIV